MALEISNLGAWYSPKLPVIPDAIKQQIAPTIAVETTTTPTATEPPPKTKLVRNLVIGGVLGLGGLAAYWLLAPKKEKPATTVAGLFKRRRRR